MTNPTLELREQRRIRELCAATLRALSKDAKVHVRQQWFFSGNQPLVHLAPHLQALPKEQLQYLRGLADGLALRITHSDPELHQKLMPEDPIARLVFDWLESLRTESLVPANLPGARHNLLTRFYYWSAGFHHAGHTHSELGILLYTVAQMCWCRLMEAPPLPETQDYIEHTRAALSEPLGQFIYDLKHQREAQEDFAQTALHIADFVAASVHNARAEREDKKKQDVEDEQEPLDDFALILDMDFDEVMGADIVAHTQSVTLQQQQGRYQVFTREFDAVTHPARTVRDDLLREYRREINTLISHQHIQFNLLVERIRQALLDERDSQWLWDQEEGLIDGRRLSQIVSSPTERRLFRQPQPRLVSDCCVTFLVDCSGSMKAHATTITLMLDLLSYALERAGAQTEVLGFTTGAWNGGRAYRRWRATGRKPQPGRLNEIEHRIFKEADQSWRQANLDLMALMKLDLYREGVDGEAIEWACERLLENDAERKLLFVLSDGSPMDSATQLENDEHYLTSHLVQVVDHYLQQDIEICAIGIGLDLSQLYRDSLIADLEKGLDNHFLDDFVRCLVPRNRHHFSY